MSGSVLRRVGAGEVEALRRNAVDPRALAIASEIVLRVERGGFEAAVLEARRLGDLPDGAPPILDAAACRAALLALPGEQRSLLERTASRIREFASAQRRALISMSVSVPGGTAGHEAVPVETAGCYAPGGRFPLPSSVLMTAVTARVAGVEKVWVASPKPTAVTMAACAVAQADGLVTFGGAQAVALLALGGGPVPRCDVIVGPGNAYVTAAKYLVSAYAGIDMLAGPSELVVVADGSARPDVIAMDLLAQAEHDPDALPVLVVFDERVAMEVERALAEALAELDTRETASASIARGFWVLADSMEQAASVCNALAPEHLQLSMADPAGLRSLLRHYGALFLGDGACEVLGDYGIGPNHVLPTGGAARRSGGLSVFSFLRLRTWLRVEDSLAADPVLADAEALAKLEGLSAHSLAAWLRRLPS